jgi:sulfur carrier protein
MEVTVNQQNFIVPEDCSLLMLLNDVLHHPGQGVAIAINQNIVPKTQWGIHRLKSADNIIIIKATQGG